MGKNILQNEHIIQSLILYQIVPELW